MPNLTGIISIVASAGTLQSTAQHGHFEFCYGHLNLVCEGPKASTHERQGDASAGVTSGADPSSAVSPGTTGVGAPLASLSLGVSTSPDVVGFKRN